MKIAALLTGKSSNTLKNKNILLVKGKPLMAYTAEAAKRSSYIQEFYVSSEDEKILNIAHEIGYKKIVRPKKIARADSQHVDAITHALDVMREGDQYVPDILVVLLANNITIKTEWVDDCIRIVIDDPCTSAAVPVYNDNDNHPYRAKKLGADGFLEPFFDFLGKSISTNRQDLENCYFLCHNFWVLNIEKSVYANGGQQPWLFMGNKIKHYEVESSLDVHSEEDLLLCELWLENRLTFKH